MDGKQLYDTISQMNLKDKRVYLATLTENQKLLYKRYSGKLRQDRYNEKPENKAALNKHRKEYIAKEREKKPEEFRQQNLKDVKAFRTREKAKLNEIQAKTKAVNTLTDAVKARNARAEMRTLKKEKAQNDVKDILGSIIDTIPKEAQKKKNREYMRSYNLRKKQEKK